MIKYCLIIESGSTQERVFPFYQKITIGRQSTNDISIADRLVSKRHAVIGRVKGQIVVKDLGSRNGTLVNGDKVEKAILSSGDRLKIGGAMLRFFKKEEPGKTSSDKTSIGSGGVQELGDYLIEAGIVDQITWLRVLGETEKNQTIERLLLEIGVLDDLNLAKTIGKQMQIPLIRLKDLEIPQEVCSLIPVEVAKSHLLVPVKVSGGKLLVAMVNPLDSDALQTLRMLTRMKIEVAVSPRQDIQEALARAYPVEFLDQALQGAPDDDELTVDL
ncbi:MAG: FHA domain-containing protein [Deltaproteobacteria bacterium]